MLKLKWRVAPASTGRYRSFYPRAWPSASFKTDEPAVMLRCEDEYIPAQIQSGEHKPISVYIADYSPRRTNPEAAGFEWRKLKRQARTLDEAKQLGAKALEERPEFLPDKLMG